MDELKAQEVIAGMPERAVEAAEELETCVPDRLARMRSLVRVDRDDAPIALDEFRRGKAAGESLDRRAIVLRASKKNMAKVIIGDGMYHCRPDGPLSCDPGSTPVSPGI